MRSVVKCIAVLLTVSVICAAVAAATSDNAPSQFLAAAASALAAVSAAILVWAQARSLKSGEGGSASPHPVPPPGNPPHTDGTAVAEAAESLLRGQKKEAGVAVRRVQDKRLKSALEGIMRCWDKDSGTSPPEQFQICQRDEAAERRALAQAEDESWQRSDSKRRLSARALDWGATTSPTSSPKSALRRTTPPNSPSRLAVVSSRPGSQTSAPGEKGRRQSVLSSKGKSTRAAGETGSDSGSAENEGGGRRKITLSPGESSSGRGSRSLPAPRSSSMIGRTCEDSSGSSSSSEEGNLRKSRAPSTLLTRVVYRNASTTAAPGQASGVVKGARQFRKRSSSSSGEEEAKDALGTALRQKPASVELFRAQLTEMPSSIFTTLAATTTSLDVSNNKITFLPEELSAMTSLTKLNVSSNELESLPNALSTLPALDVLHVQHNQISTLPKSFTSPLREVNLAWNSIPAFPEQLLVPTLTLLNISENTCIHHLPSPDVLQRCSDLTIRLDNEPSLKADAQSLIKGPKFDWNGVFPDRVIPGLFLGSLRSAQDRVYERLNITHVATIGRELDVRPPPHIGHLKISVDDVADEDIRSLLSEAHEFIQRAREQDGACFVHCFKGQSRSATVVISYLMVTEKMSLNQSIAAVRAVRPMIRPNEGFLLQIARLGEVLESDHERVQGTGFGTVSLASSAHSSHRRSTGSG